MSDYVIKIELPEEGKSSKTVAKSSLDSNSNGDDILKDIKSSPVISRSAVAGVVAAAGAVADHYISYDIGTIELRTGAQEQQERVQHSYNEISSTVGAIGIAFAKGGPVAAFAVSGLKLLSYTWKAIKNEQFEQKLQLIQDVENVSIRSAKARAGINGSRGAMQ